MSERHGAQRRLLSPRRGEDLVENLTAHIGTVVARDDDDHEIHRPDNEDVLAACAPRLRDIRGASRRPQPPQHSILRAVGSESMRATSMRSSRGFESVQPSPIAAGTPDTIGAAGVGCVEPPPHATASSSQTPAMRRVPTPLLRRP